MPILGRITVRVGGGALAFACLWSVTTGTPVQEACQIRDGTCLLQVSSVVMQGKGGANTKIDNETVAKDEEQMSANETTQKPQICDNYVKADDGTKYMSRGANGVTLGDLLWIETYKLDENKYTKTADGSKDWTRCNMEKKLKGMTISQEEMSKISGKASVEGKMGGSSVKVEANHASESHSNKEISVEVEAMRDMLIVQHRLNHPLSESDKYAAKKLDNMYNTQAEQWKQRNSGTLVVGMVTQVMVLKADSKASESSKSSTGGTVSGSKGVPGVGSVTASASANSEKGSNTGSSIAKGTVIGFALNEIKKSSTGFYTLISYTDPQQCKPWFEGGWKSPFNQASEEACSTKAMTECDKLHRMPCQKGISNGECGPCLPGEKMKIVTGYFSNSETCSEDCKPGFSPSGGKCKCPKGQTMFQSAKKPLGECLEDKDIKAQHDQITTAQQKMCAEGEKWDDSSSEGTQGTGTSSSAGTSSSSTGTGGGSTIVVRGGDKEGVQEAMASEIAQVKAEAEAEKKISDAEKTISDTDKGETKALQEALDQSKKDGDSQASNKEDQTPEASGGVKKCTDTCYEADTSKYNGDHEGFQKCTGYDKEDYKCDKDKKWCAACMDPKKPRGDVKDCAVAAKKGTSPDPTTGKCV